MELHSNSNEKRSAVLTSMALAMARILLSDGFSKASLHTGEVGHMNTGAMSHLFLSGTTLRPHVAYMSAKRRLISVHLTRTLPTHRLSVHRL